jgi:hypothetical protein
MKLVGFGNNLSKVRRRQVWGIGCRQVSARSGAGVEEAFRALAAEMRAARDRDAAAAAEDEGDEARG